jgi:hypothetical protein
MAVECAEVHVMQNIDLFNEVTLFVFASLYESHPIELTLQRGKLPSQNR